MIRRVLLIVVLAGLVIRLGLFVADVGQTSLQMDLSSFYAAGQAVDAGLSPYVNHVENEPPIWDGVDRYRHSRFLYPPPAARLFQPLSWIGYHAVKFFWMLASLVAVAAAVAIAITRTVGLSINRMLVAAIVVAAISPVALATLSHTAENVSIVRTTKMSKTSGKSREIGVSWCVTGRAWSGRFASITTE